MTALALLLARDWERAWQAAKAEPVLGWSSFGSTQALLVPAFFSRMAAVRGQRLPAAVEALFQGALAAADGRFEDADPGFPRRLRQGLADSIPSWELDAATAAAVIQVALRRVDAIVDAKHRGAYERAAHLAIAAAEVLDREAKAQESQQLLQQVVERHRRKHAFVGELRRKQEALGYQPTY